MAEGGATTCSNEDLPNRPLSCIGRISSNVAEFTMEMKVLEKCPPRGIADLEKQIDMRQALSKPTKKLRMTVTRIDPTDAIYPFVLRKYLGYQAPECIFALGDLDILQQKTLALFCSVKCPGDLILQTYDLAREFRDAGIVVISGFHSPMEKECLSLLLKGKQPVIWCPAKRLTANRLPREYAAPISDGRLLMVSPFGERIKRARQDIARFRNEFVAALADQVFVAYAAPGGKTESFCEKVLGWGKSLLTFNSPANATLIASGVQPYTGINALGSKRG
ncbi:MAG: DNA-processing protein DprA [Syntrophaceae bacterium]|nr:DNA-processing protein DprA [Syntrophaceae bacterium]